MAPGSAPTTRSTPAARASSSSERAGAGAPSPCCPPSSGALRYTSGVRRVATRRLVPSREEGMQRTDVDPQETREWLEALDAVVEHDGADRAKHLLERVVGHAQ